MHHRFAIDLGDVYRNLSFITVYNNLFGTVSGFNSGQKYHVLFMAFFHHRNVEVVLQWPP